MSCHLGRNRTATECHLMSHTYLLYDSKKTPDLLIRRVAQTAQLGNTDTLTMR